MAATFGGAVSVAAPAIVDTNASQATGAAVMGIGLANDDGDPLTGMTVQRIGGADASADFLFSTNPAPAPAPPAPTPSP